MGEFFEGPEQAAQLRAAIRKHKKQGALSVGLFGSRTSKKHRPDPDVDLLVEDPKAAPARPQHIHEGDIHIVRANPLTDNDLLRSIRKNQRPLWEKKR